ncbi:hypothetical protein RchiOBHm_Chr7g0188111 [Rosa chinensis]|uniref:Uncharacterized protein n=1 Tax=Rosa chinensis TaxID=74649 RepID=A0A2P6P4F3_ROSCH|nr:hypothetical protein RchiOBHm_Chr7g0188111 [Rosa chinensis]
MNLEYCLFQLVFHNFSSLHIITMTLVLYRFYLSLLHSLHLTLSDLKCSLPDHVL